MTDSTKVNQVQDNLLQAIDYIAKANLKALQYDETILCTITDDTDKKLGKYEVTDGSVTFTAYSDIQYTKNTQVYVTIPKGNYDNQKLIVGKRTSEEDKPFIFNQPFDNIFPLTDNIAEGQFNPVGLTANGTQYSTVLLDMGIGENTPKLEEQTAMERLGIAGDFRTYLHNAVQGNYGLKITLKHKTKQVSTETEDLETTEELWFNSSDMYGNPYLFESDYRQEKVFDISDLKTITGIKIELYQGYDFKDKDGNDIPAYLKDLDGTELEEEIDPNILINSLEVYFGSSLDGINTDWVQIYTSDSKDYNKSQTNNIDINQRLTENRQAYIEELAELEEKRMSGEIETEEDYQAERERIINFYKEQADDLKASTNIGRIIKTRWVHMVEDTPINMILNAPDDIEYELRWYRYVIGAAAADNYCGTYWTLIGTNIDYENRIKQAEEDKQVEIEKIDKQAEQYDWNEEYINKQKTEITQHYNTLIASYSKLNDAINSTSYTFGNCEKLVNGQLEFYPNIDWQQEKIKLIIFVNGVPYRSNELIFTNEDEVPNKTTLIYENALEIIADDGSNGNYFVYGQNGDLLDTVDEQGNSLHKGIKTLSLKFDVEGKGEERKEIADFEYANSVKWTLPTKNSMMNFTLGANNIPQYTITAFGFNNTDTNNTVTAEYTINNITYTTSKEFSFGYAGTQGTEQTIVIDFVGDRNAINIGLDNLESIPFEVQLYDSGKNRVDIPDGSVKWSLWDGATNINNIVNLGSGAVLNLNIKEYFSNIIDLLKGNITKDKINQVYILRVEVGNLETYFPIPFYKNTDTQECSYITGATQVVYQTNGEPSYSFADYALFDNNSKQSDNMKWELINVEKIGRPIAKLSNDTSGRLQPIEMYLANTKFYAIAAYKNNSYYWFQPILMMQNKWASNVINKWDGETISIDKENGYILTPAIAAGRKDTNNTFSGVMIGDWSKTDTNPVLTRQTGVYGFNQGKLSYSFTDDGKATIGKSGFGQIIFDGNDGKIQSGSFNSGKGMQIDLDEPYIFMRQDSDISLGSDFGVSITTNSNGVVTSYSKTNGSYTHPAIQINNKFKVGWDGTLYANNGWFEGHINGTSGKIGDWIIEGSTLYSGVTNSKQIILNASNSTIRVGSNITLYGTGSTNTYNSTIALFGNDGIIQIGSYMTFDGYNSQIQIITDSNDSNRGLTLYRSKDNNKYNTEFGIVGLNLGALNDTGTQVTYNAGISTSNGHGIILNSASNIRLTARGQGAAYTTNKGASWNYAYGTSTGIITLDATYINFTADANNQTGIYARFA